MKSNYFTIETELIVRCSACGDSLEAEWDGRNQEIKAKPCRSCIESAIDEVSASPSFDPNEVVDAQG
jgi:hypothetical protein